MYIRLILLSFICLLSAINIATAQDFCDQKKMGGVPLPFDRNGNLIKNCTPEYLYSWQRKEVLQNARSTPDGRGFIPGYLYLFRTPVGTVGYGDAVVEIKPNPTVEWKFLTKRRNCNGSEEEKNTIYVIYNESWGGPVYWTEYIVCSPNVFKSWSFGTPEIKEKMLLEYDFVKAQNGNVNNFDWFVSPDNAKFKCLDCWLGYYPWDTDKTGWTDRGMVTRFSIIDDLIKNGKGGVFGVNADALAHNDFQRPTYFLPESLPIGTLDLIAKDPSIVKEWGSKFLINIYKVLSYTRDADLIELLKHAPDGFEINELFKTYRNRNLDSSYKLTIINYMLDHHSAYFKAVDIEEKYQIVNDFLLSSKSDAVPDFMNKIKVLGYPLISTFNFILKRYNSYVNGNAAVFLINYLKMSQDESLLTDSFFSVFFNLYHSKINEVLVYLKENRKIYPQRSQAFFDQALERGIESIEPVITKENKKLFTSEDIHKLLVKSLNSTAGDRLLPLVVDVFSLTPIKVLDALLLSQPGLPTAIEAYAILKQDSKLWSDFIRLDNPNGIRDFLKRSHLVALHKKVVSDNLGNFLKKPLELPAMDSLLLDHLISKDHMDTYMKTYTPAEKLYVIQLSRPRNRAELIPFLTSADLSPVMTSTILAMFLTEKVLQVEIEALMNSASFMASINQNQFESLADRLLKFNQNVNIDGFIKNASIPFEKALYLYMKLKDSHGDWARLELQNSHFREDQISDVKRYIIEDLFLKNFTNISIKVRDFLWEVVIDQLLQADKVSVILTHYKILSHLQKLQISHYYLNPDLILKGIELFKLHELNYLISSLELDNLEVTSGVIYYLEQNYPVNEKQAIYIINSFDDNMQTSDLLRQHTQNFICKKVNKHKAFAKLIEGADKLERKRLRILRSQICN
jgi:hypothetical protein